MKIAQRLKKLADTFNQLNHYVGKAASWLSLAMVLLTSAVILARLALGKGSIAAQESIVYTHAALFMLCLGFNLQQNAHVRVDVFYHRLSPYTQAWINTLGAILFVLPFAFFLIFTSIEFIERAWQIKETSADPGGLPLVYLLKSLIPAAGFLLVIQGFSQIFSGLYMIYSTKN